MKLLFKQRLFSWFDSYDIFDEEGNTVYTVKGQLAWGHCFKIFDVNGNEVGTIKEKILTFLPKYEIFAGEQHIGRISKEFSFFVPKYDIDFKGWYVEGDFLEWNYSIVSSSGEDVAEVSQKLFKLTDTYVIDVCNPEDALYALMLVLAIDAEKSSRNQATQAQLRRQE